jgi:hypothetical protein
MRILSWNRFVPIGECLRPSRAGPPPSDRFRDPAAAARQALAGEGGAGRRFRDIAAGRRRACIVVGDAWTGGGCGPIIEEVIREAAASGIRESRITVLLARGIRPPTLGLKPMRLYGEPVAGGYAIENAGMPAAYVPGGEKASEMDVRSPENPFDPRWIAADLRILIGVLSPHPFAGWTGGADILCPGITGPAIPHALRPAEEQDRRDFRKTLESHAAVAPPTLSLYLVHDPFDEPGGRRTPPRAAIFSGEGLDIQAFDDACSLARDAFRASAPSVRDLLLRGPELDAGDAVLLALAAAGRLIPWLDRTAGSRVWVPVGGPDEADEAADVLASIERGDMNRGAMADPWIAVQVEDGISAIRKSGASLMVAFDPRHGGREREGRGEGEENLPSESDSLRGEREVSHRSVDGGCESGETEGETVEIPDWADIAPLPDALSDFDPSRALYVYDPWRIMAERRMGE